MSEDELRKKIELLERENAQLKASKRPAEYAVREDKYKGHPVLVFEGPSLIRPMTLGIGKLKAVASCQAHISLFFRKTRCSTATKHKPYKPTFRPKCRDYLTLEN